MSSGAAATLIARREDSLEAVEDDVVSCRRCPRLVAWREAVAQEKRAAYRAEDYWGRPIPGFGDPHANLLIVGLAPAAHGGNRTGRIFTGDRSGDWLFGALYRAGYANQPTSLHRNDGLHLRGAWISAIVRCAPPANKPTPVERDTCLPYFQRELALLTNVRTIVCLGRFAYDGVALALGLKRRPTFGHGVEMRLEDDRTVLCSFHPSQQNTFTGKLTVSMFDAIFARARQLAPDASPLPRSAERTDASEDDEAASSGERDSFSTAVGAELARQ